MAGMADPDPFEALTLAEAAGAAAVSEAVIRRRVESGELLHEVGRRRGKEVTLVRRMDLALLWPEVLPAVPVPGPQQVQTPEPASPQSSAPEAPATAQPAGPSQAEEERDHLARQSHAFEVRLASLQSANDALTSQVKDLQYQRSDLKDQCADLRGRMVLVERERQVSTAGLLLAQRRLLQLEAVDARTIEVPWTRRPAIWGAACLTVVFGWGWFWQRSEARAAERIATERTGALQAALADGAKERSSFQEVLADWRSVSTALGEKLDAQDERHAEDAQDWRVALRQGQARESELLTELDQREARAAAERAAFAERMDATLEQAADARQVWIEDRAAERAALETKLAEERQAGALERARFQDELDERVKAREASEQALRQELAAARGATEALQLEIAAQAKQDADHQARLEESLSRLAALEDQLRRAEGMRLLEGWLRSLEAVWRR